MVGDGDEENVEAWLSRCGERRKGRNNVMEFMYDQVGHDEMRRASTVPGTVQYRCCTGLCQMRVTNGE